ncbi:thiamine pyrophosphate-dependent enzyme [Hyphococcus flavus]|uniref:2-oxoglutarate dehydrogenase E1 component n=1 Tax=Hyphococcus flavus TaxID=1866326 RepID=A0AAE9ZJ00_9PROT|nr:thiamine pyrophosphate-dependent enzyme [Hyphococcus flavus]WDI31290.1 thiamine pyrophosphate-dependent enzyme [Hyphococcus flavus]
MAGAIAASADGFLDRLKAGRLPASASAVTLDQAGMTVRDLAALFESQLISRRLDLEARRLGAEKRGFYSIGSSGHEGNAAVARTFRVDDMAFLHYRSGAFYIERAAKVPGETPVWNMALSFVASSEDPISGGRHKVIGSKPLFIPPQTSTIASHLPKAMGTAFSIALARTQKKHDAELPHDSVVLCSFGDASANHSTAVGAINAAAHTGYRGLPLPLVFICEDNGIGISVKTPEGWIAANYGNRPGLRYIYGDARDPVDAMRAAREAERCARGSRKPVFLHLRTVRLMGHAGSDLESGYRDRAEIDSEADQDPLLHGARRLIETGAMSLEDIEALYTDISGRVRRAMELATTRPKLTSASAVTQSLTPPHRPRRSLRPGRLQPKAPDETRAKSEPQHMSRLISLALAEQMERDANVVVFGEDVGKKGGVYGASVKLQPKFGPARVFDSILDEQSILGMGIGLAHNGFLPVPEIQFLAYVHNAEDQLRGEAASLSFFSKGQYANSMVVRIAGLAYQKGFGGHFHNDNSVAVFRDIPGIVLACPSSGAEAVKMMREAFRLAREEGRVVVFLEPIALYGTKDLHDDGDGKMTAVFNDIEGSAAFDTINAIGDGEDLAIITYGNGTYLSQRASKTLAQNGVKVRIIDLRWLTPLPIDSMIDALGPCKNVLIVDECRKTGSPSEEIITAFSDRNLTLNISRVTGLDTFIPLGPAANEVLVSENNIVEAAMALTCAAKKKAAE